MHIFAKALVVNALVLHELEDVEQRDVVAVDEWEYQRLYEIDLALAGCSEEDDVAGVVLLLSHEYSLVDHELNEIVEQHFRLRVDSLIYVLFVFEQVGQVAGSVKQLVKLHA